ncbi:MAG: GAF domain-containing protein [Chloroflexi bacterium]|nr:GAF domain-containing protein [Chloroflexota bacterium]
MLTLNKQICSMINTIATALVRVIGVHRKDDELAAERAAYAEIGRIVGVPFSVANVYERFAEQVAKIIPFDLIAIIQLDLERDTFNVMYTLGLNVMGLGQGETISLKDSAVVSEVAASRKAMRTDHHREAGTIAQSLIKAGLLSRIATPLIANEKVVGTLHLSSSVPYVYGNSDLARLEIVGNQIAGAIASGILLQAERDRASQLKSLYDVAAIIAQPLSFEAKAQRVVDELILISGADHVVLRRNDHGSDNLILVASAGPASVEFQQSLKLTDANLEIFKGYLSGQPVLINDYRLHRYAQPNLLALGVDSMFFMPIRSGDRTLGALSVFSMTADYFDEGHVALITAFSNEIGSLFNSAEQAEKLQVSQAELETLSRELKFSNQALESHYIVSQVFSESGSFNDKAKAALEKLIILTGADWATFRLAKPPQPGLHLAAAAGPAVEGFPPIQVLTEAYIISTAAFTESRVIVTDDYPALPAASQFLVDMGMESQVFLPVRVGARTVGLVTVISKKKSAFDVEMIELLTFVVDRLGLVVENAILHDQSEKSHREMQQLAEALSYSNKEINEWNQQLEERVQIRTQELEDARERAMRSEKLAIIGQLSGGIAHDLRNPLGAIKNATYLVKRKIAAEQSTENHKIIADLLDLIDGETVRAEDVISNLLSSGTNREIAFSPIAIDEIINDSIAGLVLHANIELSIKIEPDLPSVSGDASQLIRALQNLVVNAQDAMEHGGRLSIHAEKEKESVMIVISDTGSGIRPEDFEKIFEPLYTAKSQGTGLGLAICQEIVTKHNGSITVESEISVGTSFTICLPFAVQDDYELESPAIV